jgi:hypothetical protein
MVYTKEVQHKLLIKINKERSPILKNKERKSNDIFVISSTRNFQMGVLNR